MARQTKSRKSEPKVVGKGKVTPMQVAFLVDQYLVDHNFTRTRSVFQSEASSFFPKARKQVIPNKVLSLGELLEEYISLKEQKLVVDQAKFHLEKENVRVQNLLQGMQGLLNVYNSSAATSYLAPPPSASMATSPAGYIPAAKGPLISSGSIPNHGKRIYPDKSTDHVINTNPSRKRKSCTAISEVSEPIKKCCALTPNNESTSSDTRTGQPQDHVPSPESDFNHSSFQSSTPNLSPVQGSTAQSPDSNSSGPKTPKRSVSSHTDKSISPPEGISSTSKSSLNGTFMETTPTNCTIISSQKIIVNSPVKNFSVERKLCTYYSPSKSNLMTQSKRDHVKGRLDFDDADLAMISEDICTASESVRDVDIFNFDLEALGPNFSISDLLDDLDMDCGGVGYSCQEPTGASTGPFSGSVNQPDEGDFCISQDLIEQDYTDRDSITSVRSITQCIQISSPAKSQRRQ